jgi:hypothetical protein
VLSVTDHDDRNAKISLALGVLVSTTQAFTTVRPAFTRQNQLSDNAGSTTPLAFSSRQRQGQTLYMDGALIRFGRRQLLPGMDLPFGSIGQCDLAGAPETAAEYAIGDSTCKSASTRDQTPVSRHLLTPDPETTFVQFLIKRYRATNG